MILAFMVLLAEQLAALVSDFQAEQVHVTVQLPTSDGSLIRC